MTRRQLLASALLLPFDQGALVATYATTAQLTAEKNARVAADAAEAKARDAAIAAAIKPLQDEIAALQAGATPAPTPTPTPTPPVITPIYTPVPTSGLVAALHAVTDGATLYLDGEYPIGAIGYWGGSGITISPVPGKTARVLATTQSTLMYADSRNEPNKRGAVNCEWFRTTFVGADILQADSDGSSLVGWGPGAVNSFYDGCTFLGSPLWTGNTQHLAYFFGDEGANGSQNCGYRGCTFDGQLTAASIAAGHGADLVTFYHGPAAKGAILSACDFLNGRIGVQVWDTPTNGIALTSGHFDNLAIGFRYHLGSGASLTGSSFTKTVGTPWLDDVKNGTFTQSGNAIGL